MYYYSSSHSNPNASKGIKRRLSEDEDMSDAQPATPSTMRSHVRHPRDCGRLADMKRHKAGIQKRSAMASALGALDKDKLIHLVHSLFDNHPELRHDIMTHIPPPTLQSSAEVLLHLQKKLADSFPYNRNGSSPNDYTFSRVRVPLQEFIDTIKQYSQHFTSSNVFTTTTFSFLQLATNLAHQLPLWDSEENNQPKKDLYRDLSIFWRNAIQVAASKYREGEAYNAQTVGEWAKHLAQHNSYSGGLFVDAVQEFSKRLGFLMVTPRDVPVCHHPAVESNIVRLASPPRVVGYADARR